MVSYIDEYKAQFGVEPICRVLREVDVAVAPSSYYAAKSRPPSKRRLSDDALKVEIRRVFTANFAVYGADSGGS